VDFAPLRDQPESTDPSLIVKEDIPFDVLYCDDNIVVISKPPGIQVHGSPGHTTGTLVNGLLNKFGTLSTIGGNDRPGIVHRLDKDTSGLMVIARNDQAHTALKEQFSLRKTVKKYTAVVVGKPKDNGTSNIIDKPIGRHPQSINKMVISSTGKPSITEYKVVKTWTFKKAIYTLLDVQIHTGR
jgi:23S rRNA pseudouridine1911/1915/1917 synthase